MREKFLTLDKLNARMIQTERYRYRDVQNLEYLYAMDDTSGCANPELPTQYAEDEVLNVGDRWAGRDAYKWLHKAVQLPAEWIGKKVVGVFDYGNTGAGNNSGFESLLYVNGKPYQGVDSNHKEVFFTENLVGQTVDLTFRLWSGLEGGGVPTPQEHRINRAEIAWLDEKVDDFFYYSITILETIKALDEFDPVRPRLIKLLDDAYNLINWTNPGDEVFYESLHAASDAVVNGIEAMDKRSLINVTCVGHTHIDVAWLWRLKHTREKCSRSFSTVLRLMEQYPEYIFLQTQPQLYQYIKEDFPEIFEGIKEKVKTGQWEVDGGMWVEADCNLTSGESLTRQILLGSKLIKDEFGKDVEYLWLPDVFGYSWALPQILKKSGINTFMTTKISWNQYNRMPHDTFMWKGIDGSEILTHFITTPEPWSAPGSWFYTYNGNLRPKMVKGVFDAYSEKQLTDELLISYGYGDGGGGVNRDMLEMRRRMDKVPGLPSVKTGNAGEFFKRLHKKVEETTSYLHTWDGELYLEYHRGTYTSQAYNKKTNRKLEFYYRQAEWLMAMAAIEKGNLEEAKQEVLNKGWHIILCNQFHDIIPGSSIREVYEDCHVDYDKAEAIAKELVDEALKVFEEDMAQNAWTVMNNANWKRTEVVVIEKDAQGTWALEDGTHLQAQQEGAQWYVSVPEVPAMGWKKVIFTEASDVVASQVPFTTLENGMETPFYTIQWNEKGQLVQIFDKEADTQVLADGERGNVLQIFEDKPMAHEAWDIDLFYQQKQEEIDTLTGLEIVEIGELRAVVRMSWTYNRSTIKQDMIVYADNRRIDFKTWVDYRERQKLMKVAFPVNIRTTYATYDVQYGNVKRPNHWNTSWDWARFETVAHKWVDLSERHYGVSLMNDCKYGHDIKGNVMRLTLLKAAVHPDVEQDQGEHEFAYSLLPHTGDWVDGDTERAAYAFNQPLVAMEGAYKPINFLEVDNEEIMLDAVKRSEDGKYLVIRFHEYAGAKQNTNITLNIPYTTWAEGDLRERVTGEAQEGAINLQFTPYEIKTILVQI